MRLSVSTLARLVVVATSVSVGASGLCGQGPTYGMSVAPNSTAGPTYVSGYAPTALTYVDPGAVAPLNSNGSYQAQRPAYFDNPSVYTGAPTFPGVQSPGYQAAYPSFDSPTLNSPIAGTLRGNAPSNSFVHNYPTAYSSGYEGSIPGQPMTVTTPMGTPATAIPVTPVTPIFAPAPPSKGCCLSRFFGKMFGTSYSTSYYRAPITYFRPVTSADPLTGAPVVVQQPCDSFVQQVQRTPYNSFQFGHPSAAAGQSACPTACPTTQPTCGPAPYSYGAATMQAPGTIQSPGNYDPSNAVVGQVGAVDGTGAVTNIPSTSPIFPQTYQPSVSPTQPSTVPNLAPLTGSPTIAPPPRSGDLAPVGQPSLDSGSTPSVPQNETIQTPTQSPSPSHWQLQNPEDSTALIRPKSPEPRGEEPRRTPSTPTARILDDENFTRAEPIEAPADYVAPYRPHTFQTPRAMRVTRQVDGTIGQPHPNRVDDSSELTSVSTRTPIAALHSVSRAQDSISQRPLQKPRDTTWTPVRP